MKYLILAVGLILCSGFNYSTKLSKKSDSRWALYFYPDSTDTTTYLKQEYRCWKTIYYPKAINDTDISKINTKYFQFDSIIGQWHNNSYSIITQLALRNSSAFKSNYFNALDGSDFFIEDSRSYSPFYKTRMSSVPEEFYLSLDYNKELRVKLFSDGSIREIQLFDKNFFQFHSGVAWDSMHTFFWKTQYKNDENLSYGEAKLIHGDNNGSINLLPSISYKETSTWYKFTWDGICVDSVKY